MRLLIATLLGVVLSLWLGGIVALAIFAMSLFFRSHDLGSRGAPVLFHVFASYQLVLAGIALILSVILWRLLRSKLSFILGLLVIASTGMAIFSSGVVVPKIEQLQRDGLTETPEFKKFHSFSRTVYSSHTFILLAAMLILPTVTRQSPRIALSTTNSMGDPSHPSPTP